MRVMGRTRAPHPLLPSPSPSPSSHPRPSLPLVSRRHETPPIPYPQIAARRSYPITSYNKNKSTLSRRTSSLPRRSTTPAPAPWVDSTFPQMPPASTALCSIGPSIDGSLVYKLLQATNLPLESTELISGTVSWGPPHSHEGAPGGGTHPLTLSLSHTSPFPSLQVPPTEPPTPPRTTKYGSYPLPVAPSPVPSSPVWSASSHPAVASPSTSLARTPTS